MLGMEGGPASQWILLDYGDVVIHVFSPRLREYYSLESLWGDAPKVAWQEGAPDAVPSPPQGQAPVEQQ
jgi:ribosome-associated protein